MTERTFIKDPRPVGQNLEWESLPIVGGRNDRREGARQRLLVALVSFVLGALIVAVMLAVR